MMQRWLNLSGVLFFTTLLVTLAVIAAFPLRVNHDVASFLNEAQWILDGERPYVDFVDPNLPLIMYVSAIPVLIANVLSVNVAWVFSLIVWGLTILAGVLCVRVLDHAFEAKPFAIVPTVPVLLAVFSLAALLDNSYGQREHLFILLFLPAFFLRWANWQGHTLSHRLAIGLGVLAAVGMLLKPHFLIVVLGLELFWLASHRRWRPLMSADALAFYGVCLAYALHFALLPAEVRSSFFNDVLPQTLQNYGAYGTLPLVGLVSNGRVLALGLLSALPLILLWRSDHPVHSIGRSMSVFAMAGWLVFVIQGKGWGYQAFPAFMGMLVAICAGLLAGHTYSGPERPAPRSRLIWMGRTAWILVIAMLFNVQAVLAFGTLSEDPYPEVRQTIETYSEPGDVVLFIAIRSIPHYPVLVETGRRGGLSNSTSAVLVYAFPEFESLEDVPPLAREYLDETAADIRERDPAIIFVDAEPDCLDCPPGFDIASYLETTGFVDMHIRPTYSYVGRVATHEVYVRN